MPTITLSQAAESLLLRRYNDERMAVTDETHAAYRELAAARFLYPASGFTRGAEANFHFTEEGWNRRDECRPVGRNWELALVGEVFQDQRRKPEPLGPGQRADGLVEDLMGEALAIILPQRKLSASDAS